MKISIVYDFKETPWGGANQFLWALRRHFIMHGFYTEPELADVVLFNSHTGYKRCLKLKLKNPNLVVIHRIDGPMNISRGDSLDIDNSIYTKNRKIADGTIFQSNWSRDMNYSQGMQSTCCSVIQNAPDNHLFHRSKNPPQQQKFKLVASSWSGNIRKGFDVYKWIDDNLDFSKYEMTFIGNSPVEFLNIRQLPALKTEELAKELRRHNIFIFPSKIEACSNSLLEALHSGLPALAFDGSSNPEVVRKGGELFQRAEEIPYLLDKIKNNYTSYQNNICNPKLEEVANHYLYFFSKVLNNCCSGYQNIKHVSRSDLAKVFLKDSLKNKKVFFSRSLARIIKI